MKPFLFIVSVVCLVAIGSCRKTKGPADVDSLKPDTSLNSQLVMSALINGVQWKTDSSYSYKVVNAADTSSYNLMVTATQVRNNEASTISFNITDFRGKGEYKINPPVNTATYYNGNVRHYSSSGVFTVVNDSGGLLSGTFNFVADTVSIIDGSFKVATLQ